MALYFLLALFISFNVIVSDNINVENIKIWGPGLEPQKIIMPARYFFIEAPNSCLIDLANKISVNYDGKTLKTQRTCRVWNNILNRKDGSLIVRYKLYEPCTDFTINILYNNTHIGASPYKIRDTVYSEDCNCQKIDINEYLIRNKCGEVPEQIKKDLMPFSTVNWDHLREKVIEKFDKPHAISLCHYLIKDNEIHRNCYGKYVGFKMFMDSILLSLSRKINLPDVEFFVNLGDWPLVHKDMEDLPIFSWCGSTNTKDIVMPTYDITESSLEMMGRVMLDILSVQGNVKHQWEERIPKLFWRGRDSNRQRLDLIDIGRSHPDLFNVSLTNFFFFRDEEAKYGPKTDYVPFFDFFDYKYQLGIDGTVAAYRFPYLLAGGSLIFKQQSEYYEHFYNQMIENTHYILIKRDLSDLVEKIKWAINNDNKAKEIAKNANEFANKFLTPQQIFCYYAHLINEFKQRIKSPIKILPMMEKVESTKKSDCGCNAIKNKDEL